MVHLLLLTLYVCCTVFQLTSDIVLLGSGRCPRLYRIVMVRAGENRNPQSDCKLGVNPACLPTVVIDAMFYYVDSNCSTYVSTNNYLLPTPPAPKRKEYSSESRNFFQVE